MTTKVLALTDALGNLVRFRLMPGQRHDSIEVPPLIENIAFDGLIADLNERGARIVISQNRARAHKLKIDASIYAWRHLIENFFCKVKEFKRVAMRACKTDESFEAMIYLASAIINSR